MNYWKQFVEMLGLELEQEFILTDSYGKRKDEYTYKITEDGILCQKEYDFWILEPSITLACLLKGLYKAVPKPWKPKNGERYWYYSPLSRETFYLTREDGLDDLLLWKAGNCFKTKEEAETKGKKIMEQIAKEFEEV